MTSLHRPLTGLRIGLVSAWASRLGGGVFEAVVAAAGPSVEFVGPVYGPAKAALLNSAQFTALASHSEGLPMSLLDSWAAGVPTLQTDQCNLPEAFAAGAALRCGYAGPDITPAIEQAPTITPAAWLAMSAAAQALAAGPFSSTAIAAKWADAYRAAMAKGSQR